MTLASITSTSEDAGESTGGLGYLDATQSILKLELELLPPIQEEEVTIKSKGRSRRTGGTAASKQGGKLVVVQLQQDLHMLKASKGDTGKFFYNFAWVGLINLRLLSNSQNGRGGRDELRRMGRTSVVYTTRCL